MLNIQMSSRSEILRSDSEIKTYWPPMESTKLYIVVKENRQVANLGDNLPPFTLMLM